MKIDKDKQITLLENITKSQSLRTPKETATQNRQSAEVSDKVELSGKRDEVNRIKEKVKTVSPIRQEKVDEIREALKNETYNVKGELVARAILKSQFLDEIL